MITGSTVLPCRVYNVLLVSWVKSLVYEISMNTRFYVTAASSMQPK